VRRLGQGLPGDDLSVSTELEEANTVLAARSE
jgi:hypothetical protein